MPGGGVGVAELVFTLVVFAAILAVLTETYAEIVLAGTLLGVVWQLVAVLGASLPLAILLVTLAAGIRLGAGLVAALLGMDDLGALGAPLLDDLLTPPDDREPPGRPPDHLHRQHDPGRLDTDVETIEDYRR